MAMLSKDINELTGAVIGAAIEVHRFLGPGLLESAYEKCLSRELALREIEFMQQKELPLNYKGVNVDCGFRIDLLIEGKLVVELKSCDQLLPIHEAQLLTYLKLSGIKYGLLIIQEQTFNGEARLWRSSTTDLSIRLQPTDVVLFKRLRSLFMQTWEQRRRSRNLDT